MIRRFALLAFALVAARAADAAPVVTVQGRPVIELEPIRRAEGGISIRGRVTERASADPIPYLAVTLQVDAQVMSVPADADGHFEAFFAIGEGVHQLAARYAGDDSLAAAEVTLANFDAAKRPVTLSVRADDVAAGRPGELKIQVQAGDDLGPATVAVDLALGPAAAETLDPIGSLTTDGKGYGERTLPRAALGEAGRKRVEIRFAGDEIHDPAHAEATLLVRSATTTRLELGASEVRYEDRVHATGALVDERGHGLAGQAITVTGAGRTIAETLTDRTGGFAIDVAASELGAGRHPLEAAFEPHDAWLDGSHSKAVSLRVAERRPVPVAYTLAVFAVTGLALLSFVALRTRPWERWLARLRRASASPPPERGEAAAIRTGLGLARPGLVQTLRRPHDLGFSGTAIDAVTGRPIGGARVAIDLPDGASATTVADELGRFALEGLPPASLAATVQAVGYVSERFALHLPHRGELRDARVDLLPVRERIFELYRGAAAPLLPSAELWGIWTPRQIFDHVRQARPALALRELTDYVEQAYFSQRIPDEGELGLAAERIAAANHEAKHHDASV